MRGVVVIIPDSQREEDGEEEDCEEKAVKAGVKREDIEEAKMIQGRLHVRVKDNKVQETLGNVGKTLGNKARALESWAGIVVFDMRVEKWGK